MTLFVAANLAGLVLHGTKRYTVGFPCPVAEWIVIGEYRESNFYPSSIFICVMLNPHRIESLHKNPHKKENRPTDPAYFPRSAASDFSQNSCSAFIPLAW